MTSEPTPHPSDAASDTDWDVPDPTEAATDEMDGSASPPDASPILDAAAGGEGSEGTGTFWNEGGNISGKTSNSTPVPPQQ